MDTQLCHTKRWRQADGSPWPIVDLVVPPSGALAPGGSIWAWRDWFPATIEQPVSLGEGDTPLVPAPWLDGNIYLKLDNLNPTGSFKDRGTALVVSALRQAGATRLLEDSSGNAGSSLAAYAAAASLDAKVLVPDTTSPAKVALAVSFGAQVVPLPGGRDAVAAEAARQADAGRCVYASHAWHPLFPVGVATQALEIWAQLGGRAPDWVVVVAGGGSMVLGHQLAWRALQKAGAITRMPRLLMVQPAACAPLVRAWQGLPYTSTAPLGTTLAQGTMIAKPVRGAQVVDALRQLDGLAVQTSETAIAEATRELATHGHYIDPTGANALAGWHQAVGNRQVGTSGTVVIILSGSGLKA